MKQIDFYYDFASPTAYLAWSQLVKADNTKYAINYKPVLLGGIFKSTDNKPPGTIQAKAKWMFSDIKRYAAKYKVAFKMNDAFPTNSLYLMRGAVFAQENNFLEKYNEAFFNAMWAENIDLSKPENIAKTIEKNDMNSKEIFNKVEDPAIKEKLKSLTSQAVENGLFGVPAFIVEGELYFGQDRMDWFLD